VSVNGEGRDNTVRQEEEARAAVVLAGGGEQKKNLFAVAGNKSRENARVQAGTDALRASVSYGGKQVGVVSIPGREVSANQ